MAVGSRAWSVAIGMYLTDEIRLVRVDSVGPNGGVLVLDAMNDQPLCITPEELMGWREVVPEVGHDA